MQNCDQNIYLKRKKLSEMKKQTNLIKSEKNVGSWRNYENQNYLWAIDFPPFIRNNPIFPKAEPNSIHSNKNLNVKICLPLSGSYIQHKLPRHFPTPYIEYRIG